MFINKSRIRPESLGEPGVAACEQAIREVWENPAYRRSTCIHEAGHILYYGLAGVEVVTVHAPSINPFEDGFFPGFLSVSADESRMSLKEFARMLVAGNAAEFAILGPNTCPLFDSLGKEMASDFKQFIFSGKDHVGVLADEWFAADKAVREELTSNHKFIEQIESIAREIEHGLYSMEESEGRIIRAV